MVFMEAGGLEALCGHSIAWLVCWPSKPITRVQIPVTAPKHCLDGAAYSADEASIKRGSRRPGPAANGVGRVCIQNRCHTGTEIRCLGMEDVNASSHTHAL